MQWANCTRHVAREVDFGSFDGGGVGEDNHGGLVQISKVFVMQDNFLHGSMSFDSV